MDDAKTKLITSHIYLVYAIINLYIGRCPLSFEELEMLLQEALCEAANKFDGGRGPSFSSYAYSALVNSVRKELVKHYKNKKFSSLMMDYAYEGEGEDDVLDRLTGGKEFSNFETSDSPETINISVTSVLKKKIIDKLFELGYRDDVAVSKECQCSTRYVRVVIEELREQIKRKGVVDG